MHGICHIEIPCLDFERVAKFYNSIFGWETQLIPGMEYLTFKAPEGLNGGFHKESKPSPRDQGIFIYIMVSDIEGTMKRIETAGGKMTRAKTPIPGIGYFGVFLDTEGNSIGLFSQ